MCGSVSIFSNMELSVADSWGPCQTKQNWEIHFLLSPFEELDE